MMIKLCRWILALLLLFSPAVYAADVPFSVRWTAPTTRVDGTPGTAVVYILYVCNRAIFRTHSVFPVTCHGKMETYATEETSFREVYEAVLDAGQLYFRVSAKDALGAESMPSNEIVMTFDVGSAGIPPSEPRNVEVFRGDTDSPTRPRDLRGVAVSASQINLKWAPSTDDTAVDHYRLERCWGSFCNDFEQIATPTTTEYPDTSAELLSKTTYSYRVRASDRVGNVSGYSSIVRITTP